MKKDAPPPRPTAVNVAQADQELEEAMDALGRERHRARRESAATADRLTSVPSGQRLLRQAVATMAGEVKAWTKRAHRRAGVAHGSSSFLALVNPGVAAVLTARIVIDALARETPLTGAAYAVGQALEDEVRNAHLRRASKGSLWRDLSGRLRRTRSKPARKKMVRTAMENLHAAFEPWKKRDKIHLGVVLIGLLKTHTGLIDIRNVANGRGRQRAVISATEAALNWLEKADASDAGVAPFWLPMKTRPRDWTDAWDGGYRTNLIVRRPLVKTRNPGVVAAVDAARPELALGAVNIVQSTAWQVNPAVHAVARRLWEAGHPIAGFMERIPGAVPPSPLEGDAPDVRLTKVRTRSDYFRARRENDGRRILHAKTLWLAGQYQSAPRFFYPYQLDFRGRLYPQPFFLQPQGDDLARGLLQFGEGKVIADRQAREYYLSHGAALFGITKVAVRERVAWVQRNHASIVAAGEDPYENRLWLAAPKPWQALAFCADYAAHTRAPATHLSHLPVAMDHTNSGLQLYALLMRDRTLAAATNVAPSEAPVDVYQLVADDATASLMTAEDPDGWSPLWLAFFGGRIPREVTKRPVMVLPYSASFHAVANYVRDAYEEMRIAKGSTPFPQDSGVAYKACTFLARHIWDAIGSRIGAARTCMGFLQACARTMSNHGLPLRWTSPSGFPVLQRYTHWESKRIRTSIGDTVRLTRYREDLATIDVAKQSAGVSPNFVHSIDAALLARAVVIAKDRKVRSFGTVHDAYFTLAADAPRMARALRESAATTFQDDLLARFRAELASDLGDRCLLPAVPEFGDFNSQEVLDSQHFCS